MAKIETPQELMEAMNSLKDYCLKQIESDGSCSTCLLGSDIGGCICSEPHEYSDFYIEERFKTNKRKGAKMAKKTANNPKGAGRPKINENMKKVNLTVKVPAWTKEIIVEGGLNASNLVSTLLINHFDGRGK